VKAVAEANSKQQPMAVYTAVIKDVLLGILTTMLAAFVTYAFSIAVTDIGHNVAVSKGASPATLRKFSLFPDK
jgi:flagellar biosynthesis protein FliR